ncbi:MAG: hypothetical protein ACFE9Z_07960 [Promethearchaeota archaeon]
MKSYKEIIKNDTFKIDDNNFVDTKVPKMCWGCETKHNSGYMVWDATKLRRIFFCENCFTKLGV